MQKSIQNRVIKQLQQIRNATSNMTYLSLSCTCVHKIVLQIIKFCDRTRLIPWPSGIWYISQFTCTAIVSKNFPPTSETNYPPFVSLSMKPVRLQDALFIVQK